MATICNRFGGGVQFTIDEKFKIGQGSGAYLFGSSANGALTPILRNSRFGNGLSSTFLFGTFQLINEGIEQNKNK